MPFRQPRRMSLGNDVLWIHGMHRRGRRRGTGRNGDLAHPDVDVDADAHVSSSRIVVVCHDVSDDESIVPHSYRHRECNGSAFHHRSRLILRSKRVSRNARRCSDRRRRCSDRRRRRRPREQPHGTTTKLLRLLVRRTRNRVRHRTHLQRIRSDLSRRHVLFRRLRLRRRRPNRRGRAHRPTHRRGCRRNRRNGRTRDGTTTTATQSIVLFEHGRRIVEGVVRHRTILH
mmetsp:Transcript_28669/g.58754  ORF Transcript_28669/g.58754 Transcript_28669/m.58754 type:complete len:229 (-) Transcript_28669:206-892(-)